MDKAIRIFYKAQVDILTSTSNYAALRIAAEQAATDLGYDAATQTQVTNAFCAVNVGTNCGGTPPAPADVVLANGVTVSAISGTTGSTRFFSLIVPAGATNLKFVLSGGTGDADMYVQFGSKPTTSSYACRPYLNGNNETCTLSNTVAGDYYIMLRGYSTYSGVTLTGSF